MKENKSVVDKEEIANLNFIDKILFFIKGEGYLTQKKLKEIINRINKNKYKTLYKARSHEFTAKFASLIFNLYKCVYYFIPSAVNIKKSEVLRYLIIESKINNNQKKILSSISEEAIKEKSNSMELKELNRHISKNLELYVKSFKNDDIRNINMIYNYIIDFTNFLKFDFVFILKKFGINLGEKNISDFNFDLIKDRTLNINSSVSQLKDFIDASQYISNIDFENWKIMFSILELFRNIKNNDLDLNLWKKSYNQLDYIIKSGFLIDIVRHGENDPSFKELNLTHSDENITKSYFNDIKRRLEKNLNEISSERKNEKISQISSMIFDVNEDIKDLLNYNKKLSEEIKEKNLQGIKYYIFLAQTKHFIINYYKKDVAKLQDILLIRGAWSLKDIASETHEAYHHIIEAVDKIIKFDNELSKSEPAGSKLKNVLTRIKQNSNSKLTEKQATDLINQIDNNALIILNEVEQNCITLAKGIKMALDDYGQKDPVIISNWKELNNVSEKTIHGLMKDSYKKLFYFIKLLSIANKI